MVGLYEEGYKELLNGDALYAAKKFIEACTFENLKKKEENEGFVESPIGQKTGKKLIFFNLGTKNNWKKILPNNIKEQMNKIFKKDLEYWGYNTDEQ